MRKYSFEFPCTVTGLCSELSSPANGVVNQTGRSTGSTATYTCDSGYQLSGDETRVCEPTGVWSYQEPTCIGTCGVKEKMYVHVYQRVGRLSM